jgi:hypothetical protein
VTRLVDWLARDLGVTPTDIVAAFASLPAALLVAVALWFCVAMVLTLAPA